MIFGNTLFFKGCTINFFAKEIGENYKRVLRKLGIDFIEIDNEICCGWPLLNVGAYREFEEHKEKVKKMFKEYWVKEIICACPTCANCFRKMGLKAFHVTEVISKKIRKKKIKKIKKRVVFHDPCHLHRYLGIEKEPREILKLIFTEVLEFEEKNCCGGGGGLRANFPEISRKIAEKRVEDALKIGAEAIVTCCPLCYIQLKEVNKIEVLELSEVLKDVLLD